MSYREFVTKQAPIIGQIESTLRSVSFLLPGRFQDSEIVSEALYSLIKLQSNYHDAILYSQVHAQNPAKETEFNRHTRHMLKDPKYNTVSAILTVLTTCQSFLEMLALKRFGQKMQQKVVVYVTLLKTILRLMIFRMGSHKMLLHSQTIDRTFDLTLVQEKSSKDTWVSKRTGKEFKSVECLQKGTKSFEGPLEYLLSRAGEVDCKDLLRELKGLELLKEYMYILRPLLYVFLLQRYGKSAKAVLPCILLHLFTLLPLNEHEKTRLEKSEDEKRRWLLVYYFLQYPLYESFTKERVQRIVNALKNRFLVGAIGTVLNDYSQLWDRYHFYTIGF